MPIPVASNFIPRNGGTFPLLEDVLVKGGFRVVATAADIDAIGLEHKKQGMMFYVHDENEWYSCDQNLVHHRIPSAARIAVIGDSVNGAVGGDGYSASRFLEAALSDAGQTSVVVNAAQGGSTYSAINTITTGFQFGQHTQIEYAALMNPDIVMVVLGANDTGGTVDGTTGAIIPQALAERVQSAVTSLQRIRELLPRAAIFVCEEQLHDPDIPYFNNDLQYGVRQHSVIPYLWEMGGGELSAADGSQFLGQLQLGLVKALNKFYVDLKAALNSSNFHYHSAVIPYFKIARLGGMNSDLLHPTITGMRLLGACMFDALVAATILGSNGQPVPGQYLIPTLNRRDHTDTFLSLFNTVFPAPPVASTGVRTPTFSNNYDHFNQSYMQLDPVNWFQPQRMQVTMQDTVTAGEPIVIQVKGAVPRASVQVRFNNGAWIEAGIASAGGLLTYSYSPWKASEGVQVTVDVRTQPPFAGSVASIAGPFTVNVKALRQLRIAVIGDSLSYGHTDSLPAWPAVLEEKLNGLGSNVIVRNFSLGGGTFATAAGRTEEPVNSMYRFGLFTALEAAINIDPDIVIVKLGSNDSGGFIGIDGSINQTAKNAVHADMDYTFNRLRTALPNARICYCNTIMSDEPVWDFNTAKNKHIGIPLGHEMRPGNTVLSFVRSGELMDDLAPIWARVRMRELKEFKDYVAANHSYVTVYRVDYFKAARMGGVGTDLAHVNAGGHQILAAMHFEQLMDLPELPGAPRAIWNAHNKIQLLIDSALQRVGDGFIETYGARFNFVQQAFPGRPLDPFYWWSAMKPGITMTKTVNNEQALIVDVRDMTSFSAVDLSVDGSTDWIDLGTTNNRGDLLGRLTAAQLGFSGGASVGNHILRLRVRSPNWDSNSGLEVPTVFGPFTVAYN